MYLDLLRQISKCASLLKKRRGKNYCPNANFLDIPFHLEQNVSTNRFEHVPKQSKYESPQTSFIDDIGLDREPQFKKLMENQFKHKYFDFMPANQANKVLDKMLTWSPI